MRRFFLPVVRRLTVGGPVRRFYSSNISREKTHINAPPSLPNQVFMNGKLTRTCLTVDLPKMLNQTVRLCGWITHTRMMSNNHFFIVLRDHTGSVQLLLDKNNTNNFESVLEIFKASSHLETTVSVEGVLLRRPQNMISNLTDNGEFEINVYEMVLLNEATNLPFNPNMTPLPDEEIRLQHRFIDLRRDTLQRNICLRAEANKTFRKFMEENDFLEIETPLLFRSTPEGAREFLVPADRISPGAKFALPQSPQQFKQMLMASGFNRYYQIARCFRDEDLRSDRQPEFTQLDMEMSFATMEDVMSIMEGAVKKLWLKILGEPLKLSFPRITYAEALAKYGSDKPDMRFTSCQVKTRSNNGVITTEFLKFAFGNNEDGSRIDFNLFKEADWKSLSATLSLQKANIYTSDKLISEKLDIPYNNDPSLPENAIFAKRQLDDHVGSTILGRIRNHYIRILEHNNRLEKSWAFLWVYDFPLLAKASSECELTGKPTRTYDSMHHPFTAPIESDVNLLSTDPLKVRGQHYDLVLNGCEIGGGSIRIHSPALQEYILHEIIKLSKDYVAHFAHLLDALKSGCPPHGGMALGLDRIYAIMCGSTSIRDVIAFPKNSAGFDTCVKAPS